MLFFFTHNSKFTLKSAKVVTIFAAEECFKVTPGKGHSVHGSYEADGPSEGLVVKLTTASGKAGTCWGLGTLGAGDMVDDSWSMINSWINSWFIVDNERIEND